MLLRYPRFPFQIFKNNTIPYYVKIQNYGLGGDCKSVQVYSRLGSTWHARFRHLVYSTVETKPIIFCNDTIANVTQDGEKNFVTYNTKEGQNEKQELIYINNNETCWIFQAVKTAASDSGSTGPNKCHLFVTNEYLNGDVPEDCMNIFKKNCSEETISSYIGLCRTYPEDRTSCTPVTPLGC
nr:uncharacterized protein LOC129387505 [Dermacentor andersoni]